MTSLNVSYCYIIRFITYNEYLRQILWCYFSDLWDISIFVFIALTSSSSAWILPSQSLQLFPVDSWNISIIWQSFRIFPSSIWELLFSFDVRLSLLATNPTDCCCCFFRLFRIFDAVTPAGIIILMQLNSYKTKGFRNITTLKSDIFNFLPYISTLHSYFSINL